MIAPLENMVITSPYGWRTHPVTHDRSFHNGIDLRAKLGTSIRAPFSGFVRLTRSASGGNQLLLTHPGGLIAGFAHLSEIRAGLKDGDAVREGDVIAKTGSTGIGTGPHLHFTLSVKNESGDREFIDPSKVDWPHGISRAY